MSKKPETPSFILLTTNASFYPSLLRGKIERPGLYNWIRAFQQEGTDIENMVKLWAEFSPAPHKLNRYDIIHINLAGGDFGLAFKIREFLDESTKLVVNMDYSVEHLQEKITKTHKSIEVIASDIASANLAFGVEPFQVSLMNWLMTVTKQPNRCALIPHPVDCHFLSKPIDKGGMFIPYDQRNDFLAFCWHRYDKQLSIPRSILGNLPKPEGQQGLLRVLFGWAPQGMMIHDSKDMMELVVPLIGWKSYLYMLAHCLWGFEYRFHHAASRFVLECVLPDELIVTDKGLQPIKTIEVGQKVLTHKGRFRTVTAVSKRSYSGKMIRIKTYGHKEPLIVTPEHPILASLVTWKRTHTWKDGKEAFDHTRTIHEREWTKAKDLKIPKKQGTIRKGLFIPYPHFSDSQDVKTIDLSYEKFYHNDPYQRKTREVSITIPVNEDLMRVVGFYLAEGSPIQRKDRQGRCYGAEFSFHTGENSIPILQESIESLGFTSCLSEMPKLNATKVVMSSRHLGEFLRDEFGHGAINKHIPNWVMKLPNTKLKVLLESYLLGDGHFGKNGRWTATTISKELLFGIRQIGNKLGYRVSWSSTRPPRIETIQGREVKSKKSYQLSFNEGREERMIHDSEYTYLRIKDIDTIEHDGDVFNLQVEDDESYCTFYHTVHNCAALGIPVVTTDNCFLGRQIWPELSHPIHDLEGLHKSICDIIQSESLRKEHAKRGLLKVKDFSLGASRERYLAHLYGTPKEEKEKDDKPAKK